MSLRITTRFITDDNVTGAKIRLDNTQTLRARNAADNGDITILSVNASDEIILGAGAKIGANAILDAGQKGVANGVASLDGSGLVPAAQLPSYVDDVLEFADLASFPGTGETGKIYVAIDTGKTYRWTGSVYAEISSGPADTDALTEGSTNLYFTEVRVEDTTIANYVVGANTAIANTDDVKGALGKVQGQINALSASSQSFEDEVLAINGTDITNGYKVLAQNPVANSVHVSIEGGANPAKPGVDFTIVSSNRLTWAGDLDTLIEDGDTLIVHYAY